MMAVYLMPLPRQTSRRRASALAGKLGLVLLLIAAAGLIMLGLSVGASSRELKEITPQPPISDGVRGSSLAAIEVGATRAFREYGYVRVVGTARNVSGKGLKDTEAVVELLDRNGKLLNVESALLEMPAIQPGADSPFSVHLRDVSGAAGYRVRFRTLLGPALSQRYADR